MGGGAERDFFFSVLIVLGRHEKVYAREDTSTTAVISTLIAVRKGVGHQRACVVLQWLVDDSRRSRDLSSYFVLNEDPYRLETHEIV